MTKHSMNPIALAGLLAGSSLVSPVFAGPAPALQAATPAELLVEIKTAFEEFKAANDDHLKKADVVTEEKVTKINAHITSLEKQMKEALDEQSKKLAALTMGGGGSDDKERRLQAKAFYKHANANRPAAERVALAALKDTDIEAYDNYVNAFSALIGKNCNINALSQDYRNSLSVGSNPDGGFLIPPEFSGVIVKRIFETSEMRSIATIRPVSSHWEQITDTNEGISGGWVSEKGARATTGTPPVGIQKIEAHEQYAYPLITQTMLEDSTLIDAAGWLDMKTGDKLVRDENTGFVSGNGIGKPRGFLDYGATATTAKDSARAWGILQMVLTGQAGGFPALSGGGSDADPIINLVYSLKAAYRANARWTMNRLSVAFMRKLKDNDGQYRWSPSLQAGQPSTLDNYPISEFEDMPDIDSGTFSVAFGDFREGYTIVDRLGMSVLVDPYSNKPYVGFYIRKRVGGDVTNFDAIKLLKFASS